MSSDPLSQLRSGLALAFPGLAFGLLSWLVVLAGLWLLTRNPAFRTLLGLWSRVFLLALGLSALSAVLAPRQIAETLGPLSVYGAIHLALAAYLSTALAAGAVSAWRLLDDPDDEPSCLALKMAIGMFAIAPPMQLAVADSRSAANVDAAIGLTAIAVGLWGGLLAWRAAPERSRLFLKACLALGALGFVPLVAGVLARSGALSAGEVLAPAAAAVILSLALLAALHLMAPAARPAPAT